MVRPARLAGMLWLVAVAACWADRLHFVDGGTRDGRVTDLGDRVLLEFDSGAVAFDKSRILRIEVTPDPRVEFARRLASLRRDDVDRRCALADWARAHRLDEEAAQLYQQVLHHRPDHAGAHTGLGQVKVATEWIAADQALLAVRGYLAAGRPDRAMALIPQLRRAARGASQRREAAALWAAACLRTRRWGALRDAWREELSLASDWPTRQRLLCHIELLETNPDGMVVLLGSSQRHSPLMGLPPRPSGLACLSDPGVLEQALAEMAGRLLREGEALMARAAALPDRQHERIEALWRQADRVFGQADCLADQCARRYRLELVRRQVTLARRRAEAVAEAFDAERAELGDADPPSSRYTRVARLQRMLRQLRAIGEYLREVNSLTQSFPDELAKERQWTRQDLERIDSLRENLLLRLDALHD